MPYVNTLGLFVKKGSYSSALMAAIAYGHMENRPTVTFLRELHDDTREITDAAKELTRTSILFREDDVPLYIMTFGLPPEATDAISMDFKLDDVPCVLLPLAARTMPHHNFTADQIRLLGDYYDAVGADDFVFHVAHHIRDDGEDWDPLTDNEIARAVDNGLS